MKCAVCTARSAVLVSLADAMMRCRSGASAARAVRLTATPAATAAFITANGTLAEVDTLGSLVATDTAAAVCVPESSVGAQVAEASPLLLLCAGDTGDWVEAWAAVVARLDNGSQAVLACRCSVARSISDLRMLHVRCMMATKALFNIVVCTQLQLATRLSQPMQGPYALWVQLAALYS